MTREPASDWRLSVAPMMDWTDRHDRYFLRLLSRRVRLYTEMITTGALLHGSADRLLAFDASEHPVALQLGGSEPAELARAAEMGARRGYDEINLNCGCPSDRVQDGRFGAVLMREPGRVAQCVKAMREAVAVPVTVKCRTGVDADDQPAFLWRFADAVRAAGAQALIVHARKAWLNGLSPKENREIPPLEYPRVHALKARHPDWPVVINGGLRSLDAATAQLAQVDGVMLGRAAYEDPYLLAGADHRLFGDAAAPPTRREVLQRLRPYVLRERAAGTSLARITRHVLGLYRGQPGGRRFRRLLSEQAHRPGAGVEVLDRAVAALDDVPRQAVA